MSALVQRFMQFKTRQHLAARAALSSAQAALTALDAELERLNEQKAELLRAQRDKIVGVTSQGDHEQFEIERRLVENGRASLLKARLEREKMVVEVLARARESERELNRAQEMWREIKQAQLTREQEALDSLPRGRR